MSDQIAKVYSNFLDYEKKKGKLNKSAGTAAMASRGFMTPKSNNKNTQSTSRYSELDKVLEIVNEVRKAREVQ